MNFDQLKQFITTDMQMAHTFADGGGFTGEWKDDKPNGRGIETYADGSPAKEGIFENGKFIRAEKNE